MERSQAAQRCVQGKSAPAGRRRQRRAHRNPKSNDLPLVLSHAPLLLTPYDTHLTAPPGVPRPPAPSVPHQRPPPPLLPCPRPSPVRPAACPPPGPRGCPAPGVGTAAGPLARPAAPAQACNNRENATPYKDRMSFSAAQQADCKLADKPRRTRFAWRRGGTAKARSWHAGGHGGLFLDLPHLLPPLESSLSSLPLSLLPPDWSEPLSVSGVRARRPPRGGARAGAEGPGCASPSVGYGSMDAPSQFTTYRGGRITGA